MLKYSKTRMTPSPMKEKRQEIPSSHGISGLPTATMSAPSSSLSSPMHAANNNHLANGHVHHQDIGNNFYYQPRHRDRYNNPNLTARTTGMPQQVVDGRYGVVVNQAPISIPELVKVGL